MRPVLVSLGGLPGSGKTTLARALAAAHGGVHLRIDSIEQAIRTAHDGRDPGTAGYAVAYALAEDNLRLGHLVIADCVNPLPVTRAAWRAVARTTGAPCLEVEVTCSDRAEHRRRVEARAADILGHVLPGWDEVLRRDYAAWPRPDLAIDTAGITVAAATDAIGQALQALQAPGYSSSVSRDAISMPKPDRPT